MPCSASRSRRGLATAKVGATDVQAMNTVLTCAGQPAPRQVFQFRSTFDADHVQSNLHVLEHLTCLSRNFGTSTTFCDILRCMLFDFLLLFVSVVSLSNRSRADADFSSSKSPTFFIDRNGYTVFIMGRFLGLKSRSVCNCYPFGQNNRRKSRELGNFGVSSGSDAV